MTDDARGDDLEDIDDALFGVGPSKPAPPREPPPISDIDWFAGIDDERTTPTTTPSAADAAAATAAFGDAAAPSAEPTSDLSADWIFGTEPDVAPVALAPEGPIVDAAIFGMVGEPSPQPLSRRELHARPPAGRRRRIMVAALVLGLIALVGVGVAAVVIRGGNGSVAKAQVKIVGTALPTTTASTRPVTTAPTAPPTTVAPTTPPTTPRAVTGAATRPVATDPPPTDPPPTDPPPPAPPVITITITTPLEGAAYGRGQAVTASFTCSEDAGAPGIATCAGNVGNGSAIDTSSLGSHTFSVTATDNAGNSASVTSHYTVVDVTAPVITFTTPADGATFTLNQMVTASYSCADEAGGSGVSTCSGTLPNGAVIDTTTAGSFTFTVTSTDLAGNLATVTHSYTVA